MISKEEIQNLSQLARLKLSDGEVVSIQKAISNILDYVGQLSAGKETTPGEIVSASLQGDRGWSADTISPGAIVYNVMRDDVVRAQDDPLAGKREALLAALPKREGDYNVVRKIIQKDE